jgi:hypothetical protein
MKGMDEKLVIIHSNKKKIRKRLRSVWYEESKIADPLFDDIVALAGMTFPEQTLRKFIYWLSAHYLNRAGFKKRYTLHLLIGLPFASHQFVQVISKEYKPVSKKEEKKIREVVEQLTFDGWFIYK